MPDLAAIRARLEDGESVIESYLSQSIQVSGYNSHSLSCRIRRDKRGEIKFRVGDGSWRESFMDAIDGWLLRMERAAGRYSLLAALDAQGERP